MENRMKVLCNGSNECFCNNKNKREWATGEARKELVDTVVETHTPRYIYICPNIPSIQSPELIGLGLPRSTPFSRASRSSGS